VEVASAEWLDAIAADQTIPPKADRGGPTRPAIRSRLEARAVLDGVAEMIPPFDEHGYFPLGIHSATLDK
jgi:hypothetical protein